MVAVIEGSPFDELLKLGTSLSPPGNNNMVAECVRVPGTNPYKRFSAQPLCALKVSGFSEELQ